MTFTDDELASIDVSILPNVMRKMITAIGLPSTIKVIEKHGGTQLRIPKKAERSVVLVAILTYDEINNLAKIMGGERIDTPKLDKVLIQLRNKLICNDVTHISIVEIAKKYNLTRKTIFNILKNNGNLINELQDDLFKLDNP